MNKDINQHPNPKAYRAPSFKKWSSSRNHPMHGTLNRAIRVNVPTKDGAGFTQKLEKVKIALKKGLIKTA